MSPTAHSGRYEILENLGRGATCRVDKARDTVIGRTVALKTFLQGFGKNGEQQFLTEAQTVGRLSHSSIAQLYDVGTDDEGAAYLVMEYVSGKTVAQLLARAPVPFVKAAVWGADVATALAYAHRAGVIHGDVTPSNIRVTIDDHVKLVDFGVARFATQIASGDRVFGTPAYLAPEQIAGARQDGRSDLFSLGVVLYEMLTGFRPFSGNSLGDVCAQILGADPVPPSKLNPAIPAALDRIVARCLAKNPAERYQTGTQLARALYLAARSRSKLASQTPFPFWMKRPVQPRDLLAVASFVILVVSAMLVENSWRERVQLRPSPVPAARSLASPRSSARSGLPTSAKTARTTKDAPSGSLDQSSELLAESAAHSKQSRGSTAASLRDSSSVR